MRPSRSAMARPIPRELPVAIATDPRTSNDDLVSAFGGLYREVNAFYGAVAREFGLTAQQIALLCEVKGRRPSFGELAASLGCDKTNITGMVDRLERRGYLTREPDPADRRVSRVVLTADGIAVGEEIRAAVSGRLTTGTSTGTPGELATTVAGLVAALADRAGR
ncbi:MarR family winged helix-turn-helix transcriptional regulator [Nocardia sp. NPDC051750]|uniref:MarR family winged helix-turn-helix transcriptional regulator n=1 Tax=Nocardia sp. NPDC051750 TaxID=3364325 RepID=UPI00379726D5